MCSDILISFIVPAYNAKESLRKCVESIVSYQDERIEVIIVENGSLDNTFEVAMDLSMSYPNVVTFRASKGVSNARNKGIDNAKGEWLYFVDADDCIITEKMKDIIEDAMSRNVDLVLYGYRKNEEIHSVNKKNIDLEYRGTDITNARVKMLKNPTLYMEAWAKLIRRETVINNNVYFNSQLVLAEDSDFILRYSKHCKAIIFSNMCTYQYNITPDSTVHVMDGKKTFNYVRSMKETEKSLKLESDDIKNAYNIYILMNMYILMVREVFNFNHKVTYKEKYHEMKKVIKIPVFDKAIKSVEITGITTIKMIPAVLLKYNMLHLASYFFVIRARQNYKKEQLDY